MASAAYASGQMASTAKASGQQASAAYAADQIASAAVASGQMASAAYASGQMASAAKASAAYASGQMVSNAIASTALGIIALGSDPESGRYLIRPVPIQAGGAATLTTTQTLSNIIVDTGGYIGRYIRIKPSVQDGDGYINLSQIIVLDANGKNVAAGKAIYATSSLNGTSPPSILVDGSTVQRRMPNIWHSATANRNKEYVEIDLGAAIYINSVQIIGRGDCPISMPLCQQRMYNMRLEINPDTTPDATQAYDTWASMREASAAQASAAYASGQLASTALQVSTARASAAQALQASTAVASSAQASAAQVLEASTARASSAQASAAQVLEASTARASSAQASAAQVVEASTARASAAQASSANASAAIASASIYLIEKGVDPSRGKFTFPLKSIDQIIPTKNFIGRYVRIRPSIVGGDGIMSISQIMVFNILGVNVAKGKNVYASSSMPGSKSPSIITDGTTSTRGVTNVWESAIPDRTSQFIEVDLGSSLAISAVRILGRNDCPPEEPCQNRMLDLRVEINTTTTSDVMDAATLNASAAMASGAQASAAYASGQQASSAYASGQQYEWLNASGQQASSAYAWNQQASAAYASGQQISGAYASGQQVSGAYAYTDMKLKEGHYVLPTNNIDQTIYTGSYNGRYIRIKPSLTNGDGHLNLSQVIVTDPTENNVALNKVVYATSYMRGGQKPSVVVDGETSYRNYPDMWQSQGFKRDTEYLEIDLGAVYPIYAIRVIGRGNCNGSQYCEDRMLNLRIDINSSTSPNIKEFYALQWMAKQKAGMEIPDTKYISARPENTLIGNNPAEGKFILSLNTKGTQLPQWGGGDTEIKTIDVKMKGRYVRILPSNSNGDGYINFSQIMVLNKDGKNIARGKPTYSTSTMEGAAESFIVVDGSNKVRGGPNVWQSATTNRDGFIEIDLGSNKYIASVKIIGRNDCTTSECSDRMAGIRVEINKDTSDDAKNAYAKNGRSVKVTSSANTSTGIKVKR